MRKKEKTGNESVKIIPLGGLEQIGMNITAFRDRRKYYCSGLRTGIPGRRYVRSRCGHSGYFLSVG